MNNTNKESNSSSEYEHQQWERRAKHSSHRPDPVYKEVIPKLIRNLGECLFPIPKFRKGWNWPHHKDDYRFKANDEIFNAYIEAGSGYGIACAENLIVVDIDEKEYVDYIADKLPETAWQVTGSREGYHLFYYCEEQNSREILRVPYPRTHLLTETHTTKILSKYIPHSGYRHLGEVKADEHGYVVGPGSLHPSGNTYGPLHGDEIASISKEKLHETLHWAINNTGNTKRELEKMKSTSWDEDSSTDVYSFYKLDADDVVTWLEPNTRVPHPGHGSDSKANFMKNENRETFTCWRHDFGSGVGCGLNPRQLLAQLETGMECDQIREFWPIVRDTEVYGNITLLWYAWKRAVEDNLITHSEIPYKVAKGYAVTWNIITDDEELAGDMYWDVINAIKCEMEKPMLPNSKPEEWEES